MNRKEPFNNKNELKNKTSQFIILDFDRTLGDVGKCMERLYIAASLSGLNIELLKKEIEINKKIIESAGKSFDPLTYLESILNKFDLIETFMNHFISDNPKMPSVLYPDAVRLLERLKLNNIPYHVLTYGVNSKWQELKLKASGYLGSYTIMGHLGKGKEIAQWSNSQGGYHFNGITFRHGFLIDDKASSFDGLPTNCKGSLIQRTTEQLTSQKGEIPKNVQVIHSLDQLVVIGNMLVVKK